MKVIINSCFGGYGWSEEAHKLFAEKHNIDVWVEKSDNSWLGNTYWKVPLDQTEKQGKDWHKQSLEERQASNERYSKQRFCLDDKKRNDPELVALLEEHGSEICSNRFSSLSIVEIPDDVEWTIEEYDGNEHIAEVHKTWS